MSLEESTDTSMLEPTRLLPRYMVLGIILTVVVSIVGICVLLIQLHISSISDVAYNNLHNLSLVGRQINQHFFDGLDNLMSDLLQAEDSSDELFYYYDLFEQDIPMVQSLQVVNAEGQLVWTSDPELVVDYGYFQTKYTETMRAGLHVDLFPLNDAKTLYVSRAEYDVDDNLQYITIVTLSPLRWGESLRPFTNVSHYFGTIVDGEGTILTTIPYREELLGTQFPPETLKTLSENRTNLQFVSSWIGEGTSMMSLQSLDEPSIYLIIEDLYVNQQIQFDSIQGTILIIAVATILGGVGITFLYLYQNRILQVQMTKLYQMSHDLGNEVKVRAEAESLLRQSEERFRMVTELVSDYAYLATIHEDGTATEEWLTEPLYTVLDYPDEPVSLVYKAGIGTHPDDIGLVEADIKRTVEGAVTVTEYRWLARDNNYIWIRVNRRPIWDDEQQRVVRIIGAVSDITAEKEAELALRKSEDRYRLVTELISDYAYSNIVYEDGTLANEWITNSFYTVTGYDVEGFMNIPDPMSKTHPDDLPMVKVDLERTLQGKETISEYRWMSGFGEYIWLRVKRRPIWDDDQQRVIRIISGVSNITTEKEIEMALRESEERYRKVTELISDYAFSITIEEDKTLQNNWLTPSYYRVMGHDPNGIHDTEALKQYVHPEDQEMAMADLDRVLNGETLTSVYRTRTQSGEYIWLSVKRQPVWDENQNRVVAYYGVVRDITIEKEAVEALQKSEERYRTVSEIILGYAFSQKINEDGTREMEWITESINLLSGFTFDEIVAHGINQTHPDDIALVEADIERTLTGEETISEYRTQQKGGQYRWLRVKRVPVWDEDQQRVIRIIGAGNDITLEKEAELALRESEERYRRVSNFLTDFAYEAYIRPDGTAKLEWTFGGIENIPMKEILESNGDQFDANFHSNEVSSVYADWRRAINENVRTSTEYRVMSEGKGYRWVRSLREPIWDEEEQRVIRILGTVKDITAEKEAELALAENQQRYREVTELMSDYAISIMITSDGLMVNWVVGSLEQITGIASQDVLDDVHILHNITHPDDIEQLNADLHRTVAGERTSTEYRIFHAQTQGVRWLRVQRQPIWNDDHTRVVRVLVGAADITAQKESEVALKESEERYRLVSQLISDYVFSIKMYEDLSSEVEWIAGAYEQITGVSIDSVFEWNLNQLSIHTHPDDYVQVSEDISRTYYGETTVSEYRIVNPVDDSTRWLHVVRQPIWDEEQQRVVRIIGAASDVTGKKSIESALRESEERYRKVTELISDYVYSLTVLPDNRLIMDWFAGSFENITGMPIADYVVTTPTDMVNAAHPDDYDDAVKQVQATMAGESTVSEYRITHAVDNQPRWLRVSRFPVVDENTGHVVRIFGAVTDVTAQKLAEMALRDSEERYRMLTNLMTDYAFSIRFEEDGRLYREWLIGDFESVMGYTVSEETYLDDPGGLSTNTPNVDMILPDVERTRRGETITTEYQIINQKDNQPRWIRVTRQPIWNKEHNRVVRYLGAVKDITLEKEAELVNREANELRQALEREKGLHALRSRFVSMVTHEFRNPLAAILSSASILDKYDSRLTPESRREKFDRIYGQIRRMTNLLEDLLEVGELEHQVLRFSPQRLDIVEVIRDLYTEYSESIAVDHNLVVESNYPRIFTYADPHIMRQALGNIISNAIKYSSPNTDIISEVVLEGDKIVIRIIDNGMGIPEIDHKDLFEAFYRASNVSTHPGTGLGLLIAKQSIELHKGTITFVSEEGRGTTFTIIVPRVIGQEGDT